MTRRLLSVLAALLVVGSAAAESTRTVEATLSGSAGVPFAVENLAGTMSVLPGSGDSITAVAVVHAADDALASRVRLEQVEGKDGRPTLRMIYPADIGTVRYPGAHGSSRVSYDGRHFQVSSSRGDLLWAEVEVRVPEGTTLDAVFRNAVGLLRAGQLEGKLVLDAASGDIEVDRLSGEVKGDTGSGDVRASGLAGSFTCDTGSGDCRITGFDGERLALDTGSGDIDGRGIRAGWVTADTGSGDVALRDADVEAFEGDTGSGDILLENNGARLNKVDADTGSGDLFVRLPRDAGFQLEADTGSGDVACGFSDAHPIAHGRKVVGYERGDHQVTITADTGSGDVRVEPLR